MVQYYFPCEIIDYGIESAIFFGGNKYDRGRKNILV